MFVVNQNRYNEMVGTVASEAPLAVGEFFNPRRIIRPYDRAEAQVKQMRIIEKASDNNLSFRIAELAGHIKTCDNSHATISKF